MPVIVPLVEGYGEVEAAGVLMRRVLEREGRFDVTVARPFRVKRNRVVKGGELERAILMAVRSRTASAVIVILDSDDDCPVQLAAGLRTRAQETTNLPVAVVCACREFEGWFLAAKSSLRGTCGIREDAECVPDGDELRDAKGRLTTNMLNGRRYLEVADQPAFAAVLDLDLAEVHSRSFRKLVADTRDLVAAI